MRSSICPTLRPSIHSMVSTRAVPTGPVYFGRKRGAVIQGWDLGRCRSPAFYQRRIDADRDGSVAPVRPNRDRIAT